MNSVGESESGKTRTGKPVPKILELDAGTEIQ
jgi:hypothetical protein